MYVLVFEKGSYLRDTVNRICSHYSGKIYNLPEDDQAGAQSYANLIKEVKGQLAQTESLIKVTREHVRHYLQEVNKIPDSRVSLLAFYSQFLKREKSIYCYLNKFKREGSLVYGVCWSNLTKP